MGGGDTQEAIMLAAMNPQHAIVGGMDLFLPQR
jgi:hypothetical protein